MKKRIVGQNFLLLRHRLNSHHLHRNLQYRYHLLHRHWLSARAQNNIQLRCVNINKTIIENMKIWIFFQFNRRSNLIWFNQLTNLKDFILHTCVFVLILNNLDTTPGFCFYNEQPIHSWSIISKWRGVCVINLKLQKQRHRLCCRV